MTGPLETVKKALQAYVDKDRARPATSASRR